MIYISTIFIILLIIIILIIVIFNTVKKNKLFYKVSDIDNNLNNINKYKNKILQETINISNNQNDWTIWPEKYLYNNEDGWKIFPFFAFNIWVDENCKKCPTIYKFIKQIKGLKLATLSKLSPNTKLNIHQGWANHSNYVIRCHCGIIVPENCYVYVEDEINKEYQYHKKFEWLIFDDSKLHFAENPSDTGRIVLILDIDRPDDIEIGKSNEGDTKELIEIINYFKEKSIL